jgi:hypothetical protein
MIALPSTYRSHAVIPFAPNADADRPHSWDWTNTANTMPSGLTIAAAHATAGKEAVPLQYAGLTRSEARTIEQFVEDRAGRHEGFWCPSFQHDFHVTNRAPDIFFEVREWGYAANVFPLGNWARHFATYRIGSSGGPWHLGILTGCSTGVGTDTDGSSLSWYGTLFSVGGPASVLMRLLWVRCVDDALTTEWAHPNLASISFNVIEVSGEAP